VVAALKIYGSFSGCIMDHFLGGDRGINDLCGKFPPTNWEKYLMTLNHSNFWIEVR